MRTELVEKASQFVEAARDRHEDALVLGDAPHEAVAFHADRELGERRESLRAAASAAIEWQRRFCVVAVAMIVILHVVAITIVWRYSPEPRLIVALFAATGISLTLPLRWLMTVARELWNAELIAVAIAHASDEQLAALLDSLLRVHRRNQNEAP